MTYGLCTMYLDKREPNSAAEWRFPEDWERKYTWPEACARVLTQAFGVRGAGMTLTIEGSIKPHEGCVDDDGNEIPPGMCGEPPERNFVVKLFDDKDEYGWMVT